VKAFCEVRQGSWSCQNVQNITNLGPKVCGKFWSLQTLFADVSLVEGFNQGLVFVVGKLYRVGLRRW
jgi:hypothetical protein